MNEKVLKTLEFTKIISQLEEYASSDAAKDICRHLTPSSDLETIQTNQAQTSDALTRILRKGSISFSGIRDGILKKTCHRQCAGYGRIISCQLFARLCCTS